MQNTLKLALFSLALAASPAIPAVAQINNGLDFTTSFPFYAGNAKMPAGSYRLTQSDVDANELLLQSRDGVYSTFIDFVPTQSEQPHAHTDVTFHKYGDVEYLNRIWVVGQNFGMKIEPTKSEQKAASASTMVEHTIASN